MKKSGFTLVELVITITILVILSTIAFVSFQSYTQDSRDANRLSSLNEIQKGLTLSYSKNGSFPTPKNATTYTGGTISLFQGTLTQEILPELQSDPKDPLSKSSYTYSTTSDGEYFQIASDIENTDVLSQTSPQKTYAKVSSALVKGNYKFDPSLPSLVLISTTSLTNSGIFSPDNCFVTNGGSNTIGNTTCTTKKQSSLKNTDSSLVGYWDMESLTGAQLLDLSGNGNNGVFSGTQVPTGTTALIGAGLSFNGSGNIFINDSSSLTLNSITISIIYKWNGVRYSPSTLQDWASLLSKDYWGGGEYAILFDRKSDVVDNNINFYVGTGSANRRFSQQFKDTEKFSLLTLKYSLNDVAIYINGKKLETTNNEITFKNIPDTANPIIIGGQKTSNYTFNGTIDEVKIYNRALSDKEIEQQAKILGF